jgi:ammonia channel protein AmtB
VVFKGVHAWRSMRVSKEVELTGLDVPEFGMLAYPEDAVEMLTAGSQAQQRGA